MCVCVANARRFMVCAHTHSSECKFQFEHNSHRPLLFFLLTILHKPRACVRLRANKQLSEFNFGICIRAAVCRVHCCCAALTGTLFASRSHSFGRRSCLFFWPLHVRKRQQLASGSHCVCACAQTLLMYTCVCARAGAPAPMPREFAHLSAHIVGE